MQRIELAVVSGIQHALHSFLSNAKTTVESENNLQLLREKLEQSHILAIDLQHRLSEAQKEASVLRAEQDRCIESHAIEVQQMQATIDTAIAERTEMEVKWQKDFEQLRTHHSGIQQPRTFVINLHIRGKNPIIMRV